MLITRKKFEEELHRERERAFREVELNKRFESMERWYGERIERLERHLDSRISKLEKAYGKAAENYSACKEEIR